MEGSDVGVSIVGFSVGKVDSVGDKVVVSKDVGSAVSIVGDDEGAGVEAGASVVGEAVIGISVVGIDVVG